LFCNWESLVTPHIESLCESLAQVLLAHKLSMVTAESCTGGLIAASCTQLSGSSVWFERGFVTYSNAAKIQMLGVPAPLIDTHGAVSEQVARAMAMGALAHSEADCSVAITGIAGPTGGSAAKPVGTVWLAWSWRDASQSVQCEAMHRVFDGPRSAVREASAELALTHLKWVADKALARLRT
jgi:nicotinamide-nucleotide amidase